MYKQSKNIIVKQIWPWVVHFKKEYPKRSRFLFIFLLLLPFALGYVWKTAVSPHSLQPPTRAPIPELVQITANNAETVEQIKQLGEGRIFDVDYSPNGEWVVTGSAAGITIYDAETLEQVHAIPTSRKALNVAFSPDGKALAASIGGKTHIWRLSDWTLLYQLSGGKFAFADNGSFLVTYGNDKSTLNNAGYQFGEAFMWHWEDGTLDVAQSVQGEWQPSKVLSKLPTTVHDIALSPDGALLAINSFSRTYVIQTSDGKKVYDLRGHNDSVTSADFSPDSQLLATVSLDGKLKIWSMENGRLHKTFRYIFGPDMYDVAFSPDGNYVAAAQKNGTVQIWNMKSWRQHYAYKKFSGRVTTLEFSPDSQFLFAASRPRYGALVIDQSMIHLFDFKTDKTVAQKDIHSGTEVVQIAISPDGTLIASSGRGDAVVRVWQANDGSVWQTFPHSRSGNDIAFSANGQILYVTGDCKLHAWDMNTGELLAQQPEGTDPCASGPLVVSPKGQIVTSGYKQLHIWEYIDGKLDIIDTVSTETGYRDGIAFSSDGQWMAKSCSHSFNSCEGNDIKIWAMPAGTLHTSFEPPEYASGAIAFSENGRYLAIADTIYDTNTWEIVYQLEGYKGDIEGILFTNDSQVIISGTSDGVVSLWDATTGHLIKTLSNHADDVADMAMGTNGRFLATGSYDGTIRLWGTSLDSTP